MESILISWEGYKEDFESMSRRNEFKREKKVLLSGPTFSLHKDFPFTYKKHILLSAPENDEDKSLSELLIDELKTSFPDHPVEGRSLVLKDPLDIEELFNVTNEILFEHRNYHIEVFISTGYPNTRVAWFMALPNFKQNLKLFQIRQAKFTKNNTPEKVFISTVTFNPNALNIISDLPYRYSSVEAIYFSESLKLVYEKAMSVSSTNRVSCLILGEHGTGKENLARFIHENSERKNDPFIAVNCAAYSDELLRSELFGHEKGAFTGAEKATKGVFEEANKGTIFLDEIGDISPKMQVSLLRVLQEKKIQRIGGFKDIPVDVRVITATNKELEALCEREIFRWDLFFRIATTALKLPPLREWNNKDKYRLLEHFNALYQREFRNRVNTLQFSDDALKIITNYHYRGNIRELQNMVISLYTFSTGIVEPNDLPERMNKNFIGLDSLAENEKRHIAKILKQTSWNITSSAEILGITRETLYRKIEKYEIRKSQKME